MEFPGISVKNFNVKKSDKINVRNNLQHILYNSYDLFDKSRKNLLSIDIKQSYGLGFVFLTWTRASVSPVLFAISSLLITSGYGWLLNSSSKIANCACVNIVRLRRAPRFNVIPSSPWSFSAIKKIFQNPSRDIENTFCCMKNLRKKVLNL